MQSEQVIRKHVAIIHAYSLMSSLQRKIVNILLFIANNPDNHINHSESVAIECRSSFSNLVKAVNFNSNNTQYLKEAIDGLASLKIEWNLLKDKVPNDISFLNLRVLHGAPTFYQDGSFNFSFHKVMVDLTSNPLVYGTIDLELQSKFESKYGHALYENSTRFINLNKNKIIQLDTFRKLLGVQENIYPSIRELTRNAIAPSIEEVNDRADFIVSINSIKMGRKITGYELSANIKRNIEKINKKIISFKKDEILYKEIEITFGQLSEQTLKYISENYKEEYILEKIVYTKKNTKKENTGFYPIRYLISALKNDYKSNDEGKEASKFKSQEIEWQRELENIKSGIKTYQERLEYFQSQNNQSLVDGIKKIISKDLEKLNLHLLNRPDKNEEDNLV